MHYSSSLPRQCVIGGNIVNPKSPGENAVEPGDSHPNKMNDQDQNQADPSPNDNTNTVFVLLNAKNEIRSLRHRLQILEAKNEVLNIFGAALQGRQQRGQCMEIDVLYEIEEELAQRQAAIDRNNKKFAAQFCDHRNVTLSEDPVTATCQDCGSDLGYDVVSRNWIPTAKVGVSYPNPTNPANL